MWIEIRALVYFSRPRQAIRQALQAVHHRDGPDSRPADTDGKSLLCRELPENTSKRLKAQHQPDVSSLSRSMEPTLVHNEVENLGVVLCRVLWHAKAGMLHVDCQSGRTSDRRGP